MNRTFRPRSRTSIKKNFLVDSPSIRFNKSVASKADTESDFFGDDFSESIDMRGVDVDSESIGDDFFGDDGFGGRSKSKPNTDSSGVPLSAIVGLGIAATAVVGGGIAAANAIKKQNKRKKERKKQQEAELKRLEAQLAEIRSMKS